MNSYLPNQLKSEILFHKKELTAALYYKDFGFEYDYYNLNMTYLKYLNYCEL